MKARGPPLSEPEVVAKVSSLVNCGTEGEFV
jgi:hypothetical protein